MARYGFVLVTGGRCKGEIGFYDDDVTEKTALVWFGGWPGEGDQELIAHRLLENVSDEKAEQMESMFRLDTKITPELQQIMGYRR